MPDYYSLQRQREILKTLRCKMCGEQNEPNKKHLLEIDSAGLVYCGVCGANYFVDKEK